MHLCNSALPIAAEIQAILKVRTSPALYFFLWLIALHYMSSTPIFLHRGHRVSANVNANTAAVIGALYSRPLLTLHCVVCVQGGSAHQVLEPDSKSCIFGCSPPPRDCTNPLVRDSSFDSMRGARSMATSAAGSCSTSYYQSMERTDGFGPHSCMSPPASALSTA